MMPYTLPALIACLVLVNTSAGQEWSRFRGPNGEGVHPTAKVPSRWTTYTWKTALPGRGHSSPVVWKDNIFVTAAESSGKRWLVCMSAETGTTLWQRDFPGLVYKTHKRNSLASSTPVVDARRVYVTWGSPKELMVMALDHGGKTVWEVNLGTYKGGHGYAVSPILFEDLLILANDQDGTGSLIALDSATGAKKWEVPRKSGVAHYSTPCLYQVANGPAELIFTNWKHGITAVEPRTGKLLWETSVFETDLQERAIVSPIIAGDLIIGTCGFVTAQKHFVAVRPTGDGQAKEIWRIEKQVAHLPTPVVKLPWIFSLTEKGNLSCIEARTGKVLAQERLDNTFSASPVWANGHLYCVADDGEVFVVQADEKLQTISRQQLGEASQSTPAVMRDRIIFRTEKSVLAVTGKPGSVLPLPKVEAQGEAEIVAELKRLGATVREFVQRREMSVELRGPISEKSLTLLGALERLRYLQLRDSGITNDQLVWLKNVKRLNGLDLTRTKIGDAGLVHLTPVSIQTLGLGDTKVTDAGLTHLKHIAGLESLDVHNTAITNRGLVILGGLTKLQSLDLTNTHISDDGIEVLKNLADLRKLYLYHVRGKPRLTGPKLAVLKSASKLRFLNVAGANISDETIEHLLCFSELVSLDVSSTHIGDNGVKRIAKLSGLERLNVSSTGITDFGLAWLKALPRLRDLDLSDTAISDEGLEKLSELKALEVVQLNGTKVTPKGISKFQKASPHVEIIQ